MHNSRILITGVTSGLGRATALRLAREGASVVGVLRDPARAEHVLTELRRSGGGTHEVIIADLSLLGDVRRAAAEATAGGRRVDVLVNSAGVCRWDREVTQDGLEVTFATNHLAPFVLTNLLLTGGEGPRRIVNVSSEQHRWAPPIPWDDLQGERAYRPIEAYNLTKLYNVLFTLELARRTRAADVVAVAVSPGFLRTRLGREARGFFRLFLAASRPFQKDATVGAAAVTQATKAAVEPGTYLRRMRPVTPARPALDTEAARRLWDVSAALSELAPAQPRSGA
jgi:NAD(P)-dependent dehydrogenase (short-subunit alcohol dehydrogenase family)